MKFDESAYDANDYSVDLEVDMRGEATQAFALGALLGSFNWEHAPASYGDAIHVLHNEKIGSDGIAPTTTSSTNVNTSAYTPASITYNNERYLGVHAPVRSLLHTNHVVNTNIKTNNLDSLDAWPIHLKNLDAPYFRNHTHLTAVIPYQKGTVGDTISAWIDFNSNGLFDESERQSAVVTSSNSGNVTLKWAIPVNFDLSIFNEKMYGRIRYFVAGQNAKNAASIVSYGEVEDFVINLTSSIAGSVYVDKDGLKDHDITSSYGIANTKTNVSNQLFAVLKDSNDNFIRSVAISANGEYRFDSLKNGNYKVILTTQSANHSSVAFSSLPSGWVSTGETDGLGVKNNGNIDGINEITLLGNPVLNTDFGIEQLPTNENTHFILSSNPESNDILPLDGALIPFLSGLDAEDGKYQGGFGSFHQPTGVLITQLPTNGSLLYDGVLITNTDVALQTIFEDPSLLSFQFTGSGYTNSSFQFSYIDAAGKVALVPGTYTVEWTGALPIHWINFSVEKIKNRALLKWSVESDKIMNAFEIERSSDAKKWNTLSSIEVLNEEELKKSNFPLEYVDNQTLKGRNYYRIKVLNHDGKIDYSLIQSVDFTEDFNISVYPNPASQYLVLEYLDGIHTIQMMDMNGKVVKQENVTSAWMKINVGRLVSGSYVVRFLRNGQVMVAEKVLISH